MNDGTYFPTLGDGAIVVPLTANESEGVVHEMVRSLAQAGRFADGVDEVICSAVWKREQGQSTGIGRGIAVPNAKVAVVEEVICCLAVSRDGVAFNAPDGELVRLFTLVVSPTNKPQEHLETLQALKLAFGNESFVQRLMQAENTDEVLTVVQEGSSE